MNPIVEEALTNMIRRIEKLEEQVNRPSQEQTRPGQKTDLASQGQLKYLKALGGHIYEGMTKREAGQKIDERLKQREKKEQENTIEDMESETNTVEELMEETYL